MARVRGVYLRKPPKGPGAYTSKEAALAASPTLLVADAAFPKGRLESVKNAAARVNGGRRDDWSSEAFFAIWEYAKDLVLRVHQNRTDGDGAVEVIGFVRDGEVIGETGDPVGTVEAVTKEEGVETGGWVLLIGMQPHVPEGWEQVVNGTGGRRRRRS